MRHIGVILLWGQHLPQMWLTSGGRVQGWQDSPCSPRGVEFESCWCTQSDSCLKTNAMPKYFPRRLWEVQLHKVHAILLYITIRFMATMSFHWACKLPTESTVQYCSMAFHARDVIIGLAFYSRLHTQAHPLNPVAMPHPSAEQCCPCCCFGWRKARTIMQSVMVATSQTPKAGIWMVTWSIKTKGNIVFWQKLMTHGSLGLFKIWRATCKSIETWLSYAFLFFFFRVQLCACFITLLRLDFILFASGRARTWGRTFGGFHSATNLSDGWESYTIFRLEESEGFDFATKDGSDDYASCSGRYFRLEGIGLNQKPIFLSPSKQRMLASGSGDGWIILSIDYLEEFLDAKPASFGGFHGTSRLHPEHGWEHYNVTHITPKEPPSPPVIWEKFPNTKVSCCAVSNSGVVRSEEDFEEMRRKCMDLDCGGFAWRKPHFNQFGEEDNPPVCFFYRRTQADLKEAGLWWLAVSITCGCKETSVFWGTMRWFSNTV